MLMNPEKTIRPTPLESGKSEDPYIVLMGKIKDGQVILEQEIYSESGNKDVALNQHRLNLQKELSALAQRKDLDETERSHLYSFIFTEIARTGVVTEKDDDLKKLHDIESMARMQKEVASYIIGVLDASQKKDPPENPKEELRNYWRELQSIFLASENEGALKKSKEKFVELHKGIIGAVGVELIVRKMKGWKIKSASVRQDTKQAIDMMADSPEEENKKKNLFFFQVKSNKDTSLPDFELMREGNEPKDNEKKRRFWRGVKTYLQSNQAIVPENVRALYVEVNPKMFDQIMGTPNNFAYQEAIMESISGYDERPQGWALAGNNRQNLTYRR